MKGVSGWVFNYVLTLKDNLYRYENNVRGLSLSLFEMRTVKMYGVDASGKQKTLFFSNSNDVGKTMVYNSFQDCHDKILNYLSAEGRFTDFDLKPLDEMFILPQSRQLGYRGR